MLQAMADETLKKAFTDHGLANECERGVIDQTRIWWVQAETLIGLVNMWQKTGRPEYRANAEQQWRYIRDVIADKRTGSEWFWAVDESGHPVPDKPIVEPWKCPYHNGRMAFEIIERCRA